MKAEDSIQVGDIVRVDFNNAKTTLCFNATVLGYPYGVGDSWAFKSNEEANKGTVFFVSEGCTITRLEKGENHKGEKQ